MFSWPSQRDGRPGQDVREKAALAHVESYYLQSFFENVPSDKPIGLIGFSFGGAVISGTLQLIAGGNWIVASCLARPSSIRIFASV